MCRPRRLGIEPLEDRRLLSVIQWGGGPSGIGTDWQDPLNWVGGVLPGPSDDVVINAPDNINIVHSLGSDSIKSLHSANALTLSGGTLNVAGAVQVDNTFTIDGGTLAGATVQPGSNGQGIIFTSSGGILDGVTAASDLDLATSNYANVHIVNGLTLDDATVYVGNGAGTTYGQMYFDTTETLDGTGAVVFGKSGNNGIYLSAWNAALTIGSGITIRGSSGAISGWYGNDTIINQGTITADDSGGVSSFAYDTGFDGSNYTTNTAAAIDTSGVTDPAPQVVYQTARYISGSYTLRDLTAGAGYTVRLHFAELSNLDVGQRTFQVDINGTRVLTDFDIVAEAGGVNKAVVREFSATADDSGNIQIDFGWGVNWPQINGIELLSSGTLVQAINCGQLAGGTIAVNSNAFTNEGSLQACHGETLNVSGLTGDLNAASVVDAGSSLSVSGSNWVNNLDLSAPTGTTLTLGGTWTNVSTIAATGGTLNLGDQSNSSINAWSNAGTISGHRLDGEPGRTVHAGRLGHIQPHGRHVNLVGTLDNTGTTLALDAATGSWNLVGRHAEGRHAERIRRRGTGLHVLGRDVGRRDGRQRPGPGEQQLRQRQLGRADTGQRHGVLGKCRRARPWQITSTRRDPGRHGDRAVRQEGSNEIYLHAPWNAALTIGPGITMRGSSGSH